MTAAEQLGAWSLSDRLPAVEHHLDIDFDGEDERFVTHHGAGQRGVSEYEVYSGLNGEILAPSALFDRTARASAPHTGRFLSCWL